ncbi:unannotated protein [freshwater metagenome]|uniref:Unannotated protein n=1 Tax=freshwater metagenome TaxID=449393 RepID=A0A6J6NDZ8_9ZZZZ|nr:bifunctional RNase H/acid phosphatase [Actinomycetota bacterium]MSY52052.1 bifunctional RNase H/acid phosphatase [Actinomycetota bacterium]MSY88101.1 bifunctional RNase H/acid phosphatase [Actinomycetota bacterium]
MSRSFVVTADGGSRGNPGPAGFGAVVIDAKTGEVLKEVAESIGVATNNVAEYRGLVAGLTAAHAIDPEAHIEVRMDSKLVVEQMSGRWQIKHPDMRELAKLARTIHPYELIKFIWIPREQNSHADRLANEALDAAEQGEAWQGSPNVDVPAEVAPNKNQLVGRLSSGAPVTTLLLIRHGETHLTPERRFSGSGGTDPGLSEHGEWQAANMAKAVCVREIDVLYTSPLLRAQQTAAHIAQHAKLKAVVEDDFTELNFGEWEGLSFAEVKEQDGARLDRWLASTSLPTPGGESHDQVAARVIPAMHRVAKKHAGKTVAIVAHVTPIKQMLRDALGASMEIIHRFDLHPCGVSVVSIWEDGFALVRAMNDTSHLANHSE